MSNWKAIVIADERPGAEGRWLSQNRERILHPSIAGILASLDVDEFSHCGLLSHY
jgi:hypothetical protein